MAWIDPPGEVQYDIVAKAAGPVAEDQLKVMLQSLLAERFKLTFHRLSKELSAYAITIAKGGHKLKESVPETVFYRQNSAIGTIAKLPWPVMPVLRLTDQDASDIATYLMTRKQKDPSSYPDASYMDDPKLAQHSASILFSRNREFVRQEEHLHEGDEVAFLPPVSGGSTDVAVQEPPTIHPRSLIPVA